MEMGREDMWIAGQDWDRKQRKRSFEAERGLGENHLSNIVCAHVRLQTHLAESCLIDESVIQLHHGLIGRRTMGLG